MVPTSGLQATSQEAAISNLSLGEPRLHRVGVSTCRLTRRQRGVCTETSAEQQWPQNTQVPRKDLAMLPGRGGTEILRAVRALRSSICPQARSLSTDS